MSDRERWEAGRAAALARDQVVRERRTVHPMRLDALRVDSSGSQAFEPADPFWREPVPAPGRTEAGPDASASRAPAVPTVLARRWWNERVALLSTLVLQTLRVAPSCGGRNVHDDLAYTDEDTRGWALLAIADAGYDPSACRAEVRLARPEDVPIADRVGVGFARNTAPEPDPVFAALDDVEDAQRETNFAEVRRVVAALTAWRAALQAEDEHRANDTPYQRGFLTDLGRKLDVAETTAKSLVTAADTLERDLPAGWDRFVLGLVPWRGMQRVVAAIDGLDAGLLGAFDERAATKLGVIPVTGLPDALHRVRERLQPTTKDERHEQALRRRHVRIEPAAEGMAWLTALLPAPEAIALDRQLTKAAIEAKGRQGETRSVTQLRADVLTDAITETLRRGARDAAGMLVPNRRPVQAKVAILIPAMTALGHATALPILEGYGPIGIRTALRLAGTATSWVRVLTDPLTGAIRTIGRRKYRPTKDMRAWIALLDGGSRGPGTGRRPDESDLDHVRSYRLHDEGGETGIDNLVLLSRRDHGVKTAGLADATLLPDRTLVWRTAAGQTYATRPHDPPEPTPIPPELLDPDDCPF